MTIGGALREDLFRPETVMDSGDSSASMSNLTQVFHFSSGNPRIEETRGVMHLFCNEVASYSSQLPVERKPLLCVLCVPNHMTYADFCQFCGSFVQHMLEMRIVRNDGMEDCYSILIRFDEQTAADTFHKHFNGRRFSSLEEEMCNVFFAADVHYTGSIEHTQSIPASSTEQPFCPVCLERLDQDTSGILTTICNHSFHCSCISKWTDSSCPTFFSGMPILPAAAWKLNMFYLSITRKSMDVCNLWFCWVWKIQRSSCYKALEGDTTLLCT